MKQNVQLYNPFRLYFQQYKSYEQDSFNMCLNFSSFLNFALLYSRVGAGAGAEAAGAGAASKFLPGAGAA
jgi:hypothetical protein